MKNRAAWILFLVLCSLSNPAAADLTCFSDRSTNEDGRAGGAACGCREGRVCVVWMAGGGGANIEDFRKRLNTWRGMWPGDIDIITVTPTGGLPNAKSYSAADVDNARAIVDACAKTSRQDCHIVMSSAGVEPFRRMIFPNLIGRELGLIIEVQPMGVATSPTPYIAGAKPLAIVSLNTNMDAANQRAFGTQSGDVKEGAAYPYFRIYTDTLSDLSDLLGKHTGGLSRDETNAMRFIRDIYELIEMANGTTFLARRDNPMALIRERRYLTILDWGTPDEKLGLLRSLRGDTRAFQGTFETLFNRATEGRKARENCGADTSHCGGSPGYWSQFTLGLYRELIGNRPVLAIGGQVDEASRKAEWVLIRGEKSLRTLSFTHERDRWHRVNISGESVAPKLYYLETSNEDSASDVAVAISAKDAELGIADKTTGRSFVVLEGDPMSDRNRNIVASLRFFRFDKNDIVFVNKEGDLVTVDNELIARGGDYLPQNVVGERYDARIAVSLWGHILRVASGRNVLADPLVPDSRARPNRDLGGVDLDVRPVAEPAPVAAPPDDVLRSRKKGAATWDYPIPGAKP